MSETDRVTAAVNDLLQTLTGEQRAHLSSTLPLLLRSYTSKTSHALLLVMDDNDDAFVICAVNADESEALMLLTMAQDNIVSTFTADAPPKGAWH